MQLHEIRKEIEDTHSDYWTQIDGPLFRYNVGLSNDSISHVGWHETRWILNHDIDIAIEFGLATDLFGTGGDLRPEWAPFPDPSVDTMYADVFYRNALVDRVVVAYVDGGRAVLPVPKRDADRWIAMDWPYQLARLVDDLMGHREFTNYFAQSGIYKWPA